MVDDNHNENGKEPNTLVTLPKPDVSHRRDGRNEGGVVRLNAESSIDREFITSGYTPDETISKTKLVDLNELNDLTRYFDWLEDFDDQEGLNALNFWLNGKRSVGGYSLIHALFSKVGIVSPEALGVIMSQQAAKAMNKFQDERNRRRSADDDNNRQGKTDDQSM